MSNSQYISSLANAYDLLAGALADDIKLAPELGPLLGPAIPILELGALGLNVMAAVDESVSGEASFSQALAGFMEGWAGGKYLKQISKIFHGSHYRNAVADVVGGFVGDNVGKYDVKQIDDLFHNPPACPLVLDLDGNGINLSSLAKSTAAFDMTGSGFVERTAWVGPGDGLLAIDRNGNGTIDNVNELFGGGNGFASLAALDSNHDGVIDAQDAQFSQLLVWKDGGTLGQTDPGELETLAQAGITSISLAYSTDNDTIAGNPIAYQSTFTTGGGVQHAIVDADFEANSYQSEAILPDDFQFNPAVFTLPQLHGYGTVPNLWVAMTEHRALLNAVTALTQTDFTHFDFAKFTAKVENIIYLWAGTKDVDPGATPEPSALDARKLATMEVLVGQTWDDNASPTSNPGVTLNKAWNDFVHAEAAKILVQIPTMPLVSANLNYMNHLYDLESGGTDLSGLSQSQLAAVAESYFDPAYHAVAGHPLSGIDALSYDYGTDAIQGDVAGTVANLETHQPGGSTAQQDYWFGWLPFINAASASLNGADYEALLSGSYFDSYSSAPLTAWRTAFVETTGDDTITGTFNADIFVGGKGNDTFDGSSGDDTILIDRGDGADTIFGGADTDTIIFGPGIAYSQLRFVHNDDGLHIAVPGGGSVLLPHLDVEALKFADGTHATFAQVEKTTLVQASTAGNDNILGFDGNDVIDGSRGDDTLTGGFGNDTFIIGRGDGNDTIFGGWDKDTIQFGAGITYASLHFTHDDDGLHIAVPGGGGIVMPDLDVEYFRFADGTYNTLSQVERATLAQASTNGDDTILGFDGADTITGGKGNDTIDGGFGNDKFVINMGDGADTIYGGWDTDTISFGSGITYASLHFLHDDSGLHITVPGGGSILLPDIDVEKFKFTDGTQFSLTSVERTTLEQAGTSNDDNILGFDGADIIIGGKGNDIMDGGFGNDKFVINMGDGADTIYGGWDTDTISFGSGITYASLTFLHDFDGLHIFVPGGGSILMPDLDVEHYTFADGTHFSLTSVERTTLLQASTSGNDTILGFDGNDVIAGGAGNDTIDGGFGNDKITGGAGADILTGGWDADTFVYTALSDSTDSAPDIITDFDPTQDRIDLHGLGFTAISQGAGGGTVLGISYDSSQDHTVVSSGHFEILLQGNVQLTSQDFVLG